jgi:hypothetical protein
LILDFIPWNPVVDDELRAQGAARNRPRRAPLRLCVLSPAYFSSVDNFIHLSAAISAPTRRGLILILMLLFSCFFVHFEVLFITTFWRLPNLWPCFLPSLSWPSLLLFPLPIRSCSRAKEADLVLTASNKQDRWIHRLQGNWILLITVHLFPLMSE